MHYIYLGVASVARGSVACFPTLCKALLPCRTLFSAAELVFHRSVSHSPTHESMSLSHHCGPPWLPFSLSFSCSLHFANNHRLPKDLTRPFLFFPSIFLIFFPFRSRDWRQSQRAKIFDGEPRRWPFRGFPFNYSFRYRAREWSTFLHEISKLERRSGFLINSNRRDRDSRWTLFFPSSYFISTSNVFPVVCHKNGFHGSLKV